MGKRKYSAKRKIYVFYQDDWPVAVGTIKELSEKLGISEKSLWWYSTPACLNRGTSRRYMIDSGEYEE